MKLYLISAETSDGERLDMMIRAESPADAKTRWQGAFGLDDEDLEDVDGPKGWEMPDANGPAGALDWESLEVKL